MTGSSVPGRGAVIRLVAGREVGERLRARSFAVSTGLLVVLILAVGGISRFVDDGPPGPIEVGVVDTRSDEAGAALDLAAAAFDRDVSVTAFGDADVARRAVEQGDVDVAVLGQDGQAVFDEDVDDQVLAVVQQAWGLLDTRSRLAEAGLSPTEVDDVLTVQPLEPIALDGEADSSGVGVLAGTLAAILLFISLQTFGTYVLTGVVEEKSTAVIEVLLVRARAEDLLAGKVIGIGVAALVQFALAVAAGLASLAISGTDVPGEIWSALPMTIVWFLGGFALYSTLFGLAGSLVSRQEDAQAAAAPIMYGLVGAYLLVFVVGYVPDSTVSTVLSLIPPIAPLLMPMRMAAGAASVVEVVAALVLLLLAILATWRVAGKIYEQVLLRRGARIGWHDAMGLLRRSGDAR